MVASAKRNFSCTISASIRRSDNSSRSRWVSIRNASRSCSPILSSSSIITPRSIDTFDVFQRRCLVARLAFKVVALYLDVPQLELERALSITQCRDLFLESVLCIVGLGLALLVLGLSPLLVNVLFILCIAASGATYLPLLHFKSQALCLFLQLPLPLFALLNVALEFRL
jgi:hypothetical protein